MVRDEALSIVQALIAGIIQGLTEFLPISSSGHLVIYHKLTGESDGNFLGFTVLLHLATLLAVIIMFRKDLWQLLREFTAILRDIGMKRNRHVLMRHRFLLLTVIATVPAVVAGVAVKALKLDAHLQNPFVVAAMFLVTAVFMFLINRLPKGIYSEENAPLASAWIVGMLQAVAILPGLSRSGSTIFGGFLGRLQKEFAVRFAFILSIPVILGATVLEAVDFMRLQNDMTVVMETQQLLAMATGFVSAFATGMITIQLIKIIMQKNRFGIFGYYCLLASAVALYVAFNYS